MRLTVVGSSDAFNAAGRGHSCYLLEGEGVAPLMVDFGATALAAMRRVGRAPSEIEAVAVTHLHGDHVGGIPFLLLDGMFHVVRRRPLALLGPVGLTQAIEAGLRVAYSDVVDLAKPYEVRFQELSPGDRAELAGWQVEAFAADHMDPPDQPLCLRFTAPGGTTVAFSGDSTFSSGLRAAGDGVDLFVAECSCLRPPCGRHCTWEDWREALPTISARRVVLAHLNAEVRERADELLAETAGAVDLRFADDGMQIEL